MSTEQKASSSGGASPAAKKDNEEGLLSSKSITSAAHGGHNPNADDDNDAVRVEEDPSSAGNTHTQLDSTSPASTSHNNTTSNTNSSSPAKTSPSSTATSSPNIKTTGLKAKNPPSNTGKPVSKDNGGATIRTESILGSAFASTDAFSPSLNPAGAPSAASSPSDAGTAGSSAGGTGANAPSSGGRISLFSAVEYGVCAEQGTRKTMEDRHSARKIMPPDATTSSGATGTTDKEAEDDDPNFPNVDDIPDDQLAQGVAVFAVYDGHGGYQCAGFLRKKLFKLILSHPKIIDDPELALQEAIHSAEAEFLAKFVDDSSGSTAACVVLVGDKIVTANVGDTEIVLSRGGKAVLLSSKHNVKSNEEESNRIVAAGGRLYQGRVGHPVYNPSVLSLAVSRAIGDSGFKLSKFTMNKPSGVIPDPYTMTTQCVKEDEFIVIGCDGLWDVLTYQEVVDFCHSKITELKKNGETTELVNRVTKALVRLALDKGSTDNVTVLFLNFESMNKARPNSSGSHRPPSAVHRRWTVLKSPREAHTPPPTAHDSKDDKEKSSTTTTDTTTSNATGSSAEKKQPSPVKKEKGSAPAHT